MTYSFWPAATWVSSLPVISSFEGNVSIGTSSLSAFESTSPISTPP